jgi:hypothetical protein
VFGVLYCNWIGDVVPQLRIVFLLTALATAFSGLHYLITGRKYLGMA